MSSLPSESQLPTQHLAGAFANVTNSYKFLWFLAILDEIDDNVTLRISIPKLLGRMVAIAWYPVNYFRLNFRAFSCCKRAGIGKEYCGIEE